MTTDPAASIETLAFSAFEEQANRVRAWMTWLDTLSDEDRAAAIEEAWQKEQRSQRNGVS